MFEKLGGLKNYWFAIALSKELRPGKFLERNFYNIPLLLWCGKNKEKFCFVNVCPHKKSKLMIQDFTTNTVICKYHGWKFNKNGNLENIPSNPEFSKKLGCKCKKLALQEKDGFIFLNVSDNPDYSKIPNFGCEKYKNFYKNMIFETNEEFLIENFMDATHTPFVHDKIIRDSNKKTKHNIKIVKKGNSLKAYFGKTQENVGLRFNSFFKNKFTISHIDEFLLPNIIKVDYTINNIHRFQAIIACTQIANGKTIALLKISYNFGFLNFFLKLLLPQIAQKVLVQDFEITQSQFENIKFFPDEKEHHIQYDLLHNQMRLIRKNITLDRENKGDFEKEIQIIV